ncbi:MAG: hypothetical protein H0W83_11930, partial [Planctomycetes bacterium]|nr:hypothetical protein [Planctomycetota bacterium]
MTSFPRFPLVLTATAALAIGGCGGDVVTAKRATGAESVDRLQAPMARSSAITAKLNQYRAETYGMAMDVQHRNVLYTAAYRHAVFLNTVNSASYDSRSPNSGTEGSIITPNSGREDLLTEMDLRTTGVFPALFTNADPYTRVERVVGSPDVLDGTRSLVYEDYVFSGNIWRADGTTSAFRGFDRDSQNVAFDEVDNLWYTRHGRTMLMRPTLRSIGYGAVGDGSVSPPWPILNGRFLGVFSAIVSRPLTAQLGRWPGPG